MGILRDNRTKAATPIARRLCHLNLGFWRDRHLHRILRAANHQLGFARHKDKGALDCAAVVWGASPRAWRGEALAQRFNLPLVRIEDAFLRSLRPGRQGGGAAGLILDADGVHFDPSRPSKIEIILAHDPLDDSHLLARAKVAMARLRRAEISKYNLHWRSPPPAGYVLVIDQLRNDASVLASGATQSTFDEMLEAARAAHPRAKIWIKRHPETTQGLRAGHYSEQHLTEDIAFLEDDVLPYALLEGAIAVYTVSSQMGFEAIVAGHRPKVWGAPFYAGWGLSDDQEPVARRQRRLTPAQLFAAAMILAPIWYDPVRDEICPLERVIDQLEAEARAYREDKDGYVCFKMRVWKRPYLQAFFGEHKRLRFQNTPPAGKARLLLWGSQPSPYGTPAPAAEKTEHATLFRLEDGFLRSNGLGAQLVPPLSLIRDQIGIYYDPSQTSELETHIMTALPPGGRTRAESLIEALRRAQVSKYNLQASPTSDALDARGLAEKGRHIVLVVGQVEDDASILKGASEIRGNLELLSATRARLPDAYLIYKPHPDCEAGLRKGALDEATVLSYADQIAKDRAIAPLLELVDEVATITSLTGFEALLRGRLVTTHGAPFYAGWGLTQDLGEVPLRRLRAEDGSLRPRPDLVHLAHAALISAPRYYDPRLKRATTPEAALYLLTEGIGLKRGPLNRLLAKVQGRFIGVSSLWR